MIARAIAILCLLACDASAQPFDFRGIRPRLANEPRALSIRVDVLPYAGFRDVRTLGKAPEFVRAVSGFNLPTRGIRSLPEFVADVGALYRSRFSTFGVILPQVHLEYATKSFEFTFRGGAVNVTTGQVFVLEREFNFFDIGYYNDGTAYLRTEEQTVLAIHSRTLAGGEAWGMLKIPVKASRYRLQLLLGLGASVAYAHAHAYTLTVAPKLSQYAVLDNQTTTSGHVVGGMGMRVGLQLDGYRYLRPRVVLEVMGMTDRRNGGLPMVSIGASLRVWKVATVGLSVLDIANYELRLEASRGLGRNSEVVLGGVVRSKLMRSDFAYASLSVGSKFLKFTATALMARRRLGVLIGMGLGYWP